MDSFVKKYQSQIINAIDDAVNNNCEGCKINHPSQRHHDCLMLSDEDRVHLYFDFVWSTIDKEQMLNEMKEFLENAVRKSPLATPLEDESPSDGKD